jgi:hypothetical protein
MNSETSMTSTTPSDARARALRDRYFALAEAHASEAERAALRDEIAALDVGPTLALEGLDMAWHPSRRFRVPRFVARERIPEPLRERFTSPPGSPELAAVFVDPDELSYRNFENILPLDHYLAPALHAAPDVQLGKRVKLGKRKQPLGYAIPLELAASLRDALLGLDRLGLYAEPLDSSQRGGRRFVFHAATLAAALEQPIRAALPKTWAKGFVHVNPVFRCNRFEPHDAKFHAHLDTPYYDAARKQVSRYTLLIYLSGGEAQPGAPVLRIAAEPVLERVEAFTCVILPQEHVHEGAPFVAGAKLFLRSELIFESEQLAHDPRIASLFARACYLTGESLMWPQLARRATELYDRAAAAHFGAAPHEPGRTTWLHKRWRGRSFVTSGHDYWFAKREGTLDELREAAVVALLDQLNCKIGGRAFRSQCESTPLDASEPASAWVPARLHAEPQPRAGEPLFVPLDRASLLPPSEDIDPRICCAFHSMPRFDPTRAQETVSLYERAQKFVKRRLDSAPITMLGQEVFVELERIAVEPGRIHVLADASLEPLNFAACWNDGSSPENYLDTETWVDAPKLLVPPILFVETPECWRLSLDLFRNDWLVSASDRHVPIPRLRELSFEDYEDGDMISRPWFDAALKSEGWGEQAAASDEGESDADEEDEEEDEDEDEEEDELDEFWWEDPNNPLVRELYGKD